MNYTETFETLKNKSLPIIQLDNGDIYQGQIVNGSKHGLGRFNWYIF
jgi:hypothetical protein